MMETNSVPKYDQSDNETGCCPRFDPTPWEGQDLHFRDKLFVRATVRSFMHVPLNMAIVFQNTFNAIRRANAEDEAFVVLSREISPWQSEHLFSVKRPVPDLQNVKLSGEFLTHVFEGPYKNAPSWCNEMADYVRKQGKALKTQFFFYTTCPKCAAHYGKNYVVGVAEIAA